MSGSHLVPENGPWNSYEEGAVMMTIQKIPSGQRQQMIAEAAYFRAERRGFRDGDPMTDWIEAEKEVEQRLQEIEDEHLVVSFEERLRMTNERLGALKRKASRLKAETREALHRDAEKLAQLRDALEQQLEAIRRQGEEAGHKARQHAEKLWKEISDLIERLGSRGRTS
jgi:predicted RNase H-like nuclease (RuvC/YqgF family)